MVIILRKRPLLLIILIILTIVNVLYYITKSSGNYLNTYYITKVDFSYKKYEEKIHPYEISAYIPISNYDLLNKEINYKINRKIKAFKYNIKNIDVQQSLCYTLNIKFDFYSYQNYLSYVFFIEDYTGGAHEENNKIIDIKNLREINPKVLEILSCKSRQILITNSKIVDINMLMEGTRPKEENFNNFAFSNHGLILFFNYYQVAPYSSGSFEIEVSYDDIF